MDIVTLAAARKGGGSGGDVTKQYVDDHLALKADKTETAEYPIASTTTGINPTITDSADGLIQDVKVYGRSDVSKNILNPSFVGTSDISISSSNSGINVTTTAAISQAVIVKAAPINLKAGIQYVLSGAGAVAEVQLSLRDANGNYSDKVNMNPLSVYDGNYATVIASQDITIYPALRVQTAGAISVFVKPQLELGSTPTPYEPYFSGIHGIGEDGELEITTANSDNTASTTATVTTGIPLYAVGDVKDELDEKKGVAVKRREKVVLNGSEQWEIWNGTPATSGSLAFQFGLTVQAKTVGSDVIPNVITTGNLEIASNNTVWNSDSNYICVNNLKTRIRIIGIASVADLKTYLASNPVTVVYELATPTTQELTSTELSALRNLRTYNPTTNVTITDDPTIGIGYLLNTDNGQAVSAVQQGLQGQISNIPAWLTDIPENHKNIYRGKYLGNSVSAAQLGAIADGSFDDLYVGDYWTIPVTIDNVEQSVNWRIADIDYFIGYRDAVDTTKRMTTHHLVIVPDTMLYKSQPGNRSNGYNGSGIRTSGLDKAKTAINAAFPDMVLSHKNYISTAIDSNGTVTQCEEQTCTIELMSEVMVFGFNRFQQVANQQGNVYYSLGGQFALFSLCPKWKSHNAEEPIIPISGYMLQDPCYASSFEYWTGAWTLRIGPVLYTNDLGVRPYFLLGDAGT